MEEEEEISSWMGKKGSKFGFWHKRFCVLNNESMEMRVYKSDNRKTLERTIKIDSEVTCEIMTQKKPPRFIVTPKDERCIVLSNESIETINEWVSCIRTLTLVTPGITMNDFNEIAVIGRGTYGKVTLCQRKSDAKLFAIKSIHKNLLMKSHKSVTVVNERNFLMNTKHPFIIKLYFAFQSRSKLFMGMEYAPGGDLHYNLSISKNFTIERIRLYVAEISLAIDYLHRKNYVYRDLKPENILLSEKGHVKLADFGLVKSLNYVENLSTLCGTPTYLAPEVILQIGYGPMVDWWGVGILIYHLTFRKCPWDDENIKELFDKIVNAPLLFPPDSDKNVVDLVTKLLQKNPDDRCGIDYLLNHPFFNGLDFAEVYKEKIKPPFIPNVNKNILKPENFEECFLNEEIIDSVATPIGTDSDAFVGFSYIAAEEKGPDRHMSVNESELEKYRPTSVKFDLVTPPSPH